MPRTHADDNLLPFPGDAAMKATHAKMDAANKAWDVFLAAHRSALLVGSVNAMRASIAAFELFEAAAKDL